MRLAPVSRAYRRRSVRLHHFGLGPLLLLALVGASARAADPVAERNAPHLGLSLGVGHSHTLLGVQLEFQLGRFAAFVSTGAALLAPDNASIGAGIRYHANGSEPGVFLSLQTAYYDSPSFVAGRRNSLWAISGIVGWRFVFGERWFLDLGAGPVFVRNMYWEDEGPNAPYDSGGWGFGLVGGPDFGPPIPDVTLAFGHRW
jgi:hypothetical protein